MPIALSNLLIYNNVESTDPLLGATKIPFFREPTYIPNVTFVNGYEEFLAGRAGLGSQVLVRKLGKRTATKVKATAAGALDYVHVETADTLQIIPLDDVIKQSEKIYEVVERVRNTPTAGMKAEVVARNIGDKIQEVISGYIQASALASVSKKEAPTKSTIKDLLITDLQALDYKPNTLVVSKTVMGLLLQLTTDEGWTRYNGFDTIHTALIGDFLGMSVYVDPNLDSKCDWVMYDFTKFGVFIVLEDFDLIPANLFKGSYCRGMVLMGNETNLAGFTPTTTGNGAWAVKHLNAASS